MSTVDDRRLPARHEPVDVSAGLREAAGRPPQRVTRPTSGTPVEEATVAKRESVPRE